MTVRTFPSKPRALLLDTNVWIDSQFGMHPGYASAHGLIVAARRGGVRLGVAVHSLNDVFYIVRQELKRANAVDAAIPAERIAAAAKETAWGVVNSIAEYAEIVGADGSDVRIAALHRVLHDDYEDDLVLAAARRMGADLVVTGDLTLIKHSPLPAMTPGDALKWIEG